MEENIQSTTFSEEKTKDIIKWIKDVEIARRTIDRSENWTQPVDWRIVTGKTIIKYLPFEGGNLPIHQAFRNVMEKLAPHYIIKILIISD